MKRLIIIPTYNEAQNIKVIIPRIFKHIQGASILVVDDGSPDGTADLVKELQSEYSNLFLEQRKSKSGLGSAYRFGFRWGLERGFEELIEMDADLSHRVRDLARMIECKDSDSNIGLVIGSRWISGGEIENWSKGREVLSRFANRYVRIALNLNVNDSTSGFRIYSADLIKKIDVASIQSEGYCFQIEMTRAARKAGAKIVEVPITFRERESGVSKMSKAIVFEAMALVTLWGAKRILRSR
jgi:glycosyltransferase involved in cell wall biosynthesis